MAADATSQRLIMLYRRAHQAVQAQVASAVVRGALGTEAQRRRQLQAIRVILARLEAQANPLLPDALGKPYGAGATAVDVVMGLDDRPFRFAGVHERAVMLGVLALQGHLHNAIVNVGRHVDDIFRQVQLEQATVGVAAGDRRVDVTRRMVADLRGRGITAFVDRRGRRWNLDTYATMTVRTNTREMVSLGTVNRLVENGQDLIEISWHATACDICRPHEREVYSLTGRDRRYPRVGTPTAKGVIARPTPFHPNCEHVTGPASATFDDFERALLEADVEVPIRIGPTPDIDTLVRLPSTRPGDLPFPEPRRGR